MDLVILTRVCKKERWTVRYHFLPLKLSPANPSSRDNEGVFGPHFGKDSRLVFDVIWLNFIQESNCSVFSSICEPWIIEHITTSSIVKGINSKT